MPAFRSPPVPAATLAAIEPLGFNVTQLVYGDDGHTAELHMREHFDFAADWLVRVKNTPSTRGLKRAQRLRNVSGAFQVRPGAAPMLKGRHILLVDDVMTTGATAGACARVLRRAGAARVDVITYARVAAADATPYLQGVSSQEAHGQD